MKWPYSEFQRDFDYYLITSAAKKKKKKLKLAAIQFIE